MIERILTPLTDKEKNERINHQDHATLGLPALAVLSSFATASYFGLRGENGVAGSFLAMFPFLGILGFALGEPVGAMSYDIGRFFRASALYRSGYVN